jgi:SAM-dependent methyltransferase
LLRTGRAMRSDRVVVPTDLCKYQCSRCGLVRGEPAWSDNLHALYTGDYAVAPPDYVFHTADGPVTRSALFCRWIVEAMGAFRWRNVGKCLEIGAGAGALLAEFQERFPDTRFEGIELSAPAVAAARELGRNVRQRDLDDVTGTDYDAIYAVAVLEHVPSPTQFLTAIRRRLRPGGWLFLTQPTQDVPSYDAFFVDHLHHFGSEHLRGYARKCGFREVGCVVGHEWMPNFSLHLWQAAGSPAAYAWYGPPEPTACADAVRRVCGDLARLDDTLDRLTAERRRVAVFGLNEVYGLARAYSQLGSYPVVCGLDDRPEQPAYRQLDFPVVVPEACTTFGVQDVVLAVNQVYYPHAMPRLERLGVIVHPILN